MLLELWDVFLSWSRSSYSARGRAKWRGCGRKNMVRCHVGTPSKPKKHGNAKKMNKRQYIIWLLFNRIEVLFKKNSENFKSERFGVSFCFILYPHFTKNNNCSAYRCRRCRSFSSGDMEFTDAAERAVSKLLPSRDELSSWSKISDTMTIHDYITSVCKSGLFPEKEKNLQKIWQMRPNKKHITKRNDQNHPKSIIISR